MFKKRTIKVKLEKIFKGLILSQVIIVIFYISIIFFFPTPDMPKELQLKYVQPIEEMYCLFLIAIIFIFCVIYPWSFYKLYKFQNSGRNIYLVCYILSFLLMIMSGNGIETPWTSIFGVVEENITGFMIALMYFSPLKEKFT
jgi:uncharacterized membrane protein HdeD (DUF308 family)